MNGGGELREKRLLRRGQKGWIYLTFGCSCALDKVTAGLLNNKFVDFSVLHNFVLSRDDF